MSGPNRPSSLVSFAVVLAFASGPGLVAQVVVETGGTRLSSRLIYALDVRRSAELVLHYEPTVWRKEYAVELKREKAERFRLGAGYWTTLHNGADLSLGGKKLPAHVWHLGLQRSADAKWCLVFLDSVKVARGGLVSGSDRDAKPDVVVPLDIVRGKQEVARLEIRLRGEKQFGRAAIELAWGPFACTVPMRVGVTHVKPAGEPAFARPRRDALVTTPSGLKYEELRPGAGPLARADSEVEVRYVGWLDSGEKFDSSFSRGESATFGVERLIPGWREGLTKMRAGSVFRLEVPSALAYGERGAGPIPAGATIHFWVELVAIRR